MKSKLFSLVCGILLLCTMLLPVTSHADTVHDAQSVMDGIVGYQLAETGASDVQGWIDGDLTANAGITSEWYILALSQQGTAYDFSRYEAALLAYLNTAGVSSASTRQKYALVLAAIGSDSPYIGETLRDSIGEQGIMSWVCGLHLLNNGYTSEQYSAEEIVNTILSLQLPDGGWVVSGTVSDTDVTAMTLQALAPHADAHGDAIDRALTRLSELQLEDGDYRSYGIPNPESTAQVITALSALGIDCMTDGRFIKNGNTLFDGIAKYRLPDGSFCHTEGGAYSQIATVQVYHALTGLVQGTNMYLFSQKSSSVPEAQPLGYKLPACLIIAGIGGAVCIMLFVIKKRNKKNFLVVLAVTAIGIVFVCLTDFQSAQEYYGTVSTPEEISGTVTLTIRCDTVAGKQAHIPADGVILEETEFPVSEGDTVFDVLTRAAQANSIQMEYSGSPEMAYISGIGYLYEFDFGDLSGWVYHVNEASPDVGCGEYTLHDGDAIEWLYSCDLGNDVK